MKNNFNVKRAIKFGLLAYLITFALGIIVGIALGFDFETSEFPDSVYYAGIVTVIATMTLISWLFFKKKGSNPSAKNGAWLGLAVFLTGIVLDTLIALPVWLDPAARSEFIVYYQNPLFWLSVAALFATTITAGHIMQTKKGS